MIPKRTDGPRCKALADREVAGLLAAFHGTYATRNRAMFLLGESYLRKNSEPASVTTR